MNNETLVVVLREGSDWYKRFNAEKLSGLTSCKSCIHKNWHISDFDMDLLQGLSHDKNLLAEAEYYPQQELLFFGYLV